MSNIAWMSLPADLKARVKWNIVPLKTKEWNEDMAVLVWEFLAPFSSDAECQETEVAALCEAVYRNKVALSLGR